MKFNTDLKRYMKIKGLSAKDLFEKLQQDPKFTLAYGSFLHVICGRPTSPRIAFSIQKTTNGYVKAMDLVSK